MKNLQKGISLLFFSLFMIMFNVPVNAAVEIPDVACVIHAEDSELGEVFIYVPCDDSIKFSMKNNDFVLISSEEVNGYMNVDLVPVINFEPYQLGKYHNFDTGDMTNLNFVQIYDDTNVQVISDSSIFISNNFNVVLCSLILFGGLVLCLTYMKH